MVNSFFIPYVPDEQRRRSKDRLNRLMQYVAWLNMTGGFWFTPDLQAYKAYLIGLGTLQLSSVNSFLAAVRARYRDILKDQYALQLELSQALPGRLNASKFFDDCVKKMKIAADPRNTKMSYEAKTRHYAVITTNQASQLLSTPDTHTLRGLRDTTIFAVMMGMGLRETELRLLTVEDLIFTGGAGEIGIHVPEGQASTERFVPFYEKFPVQKILETWLSRSRIKEGPVFRGFFKNERKIRETAITIQTIEDIFRLYPINEGEESIQIKPFDLRIFYARMLYALDFSLDVIAQNLGVQTQTAANYIGTPVTVIENIPAFELNKLDYRLQNP